MSSPPTANPSEIARETLRRLAAERIPPTPDNYRALYHQISGTAINAEEVALRRAVQEVVASLLHCGGEKARLAQQADGALRSGNWQALAPLLLQATQQTPTPTKWGELLRTTLQQLNAARGETALVQRCESLEQLVASPHSPESLAERLTGLAAQWARENDHERGIQGGAAPQPVALRSDEPRPVPPQPELSGMLAAVRDLSAFILESPCAAALSLQPKLADEAARLSRDLRRKDDLAGLADLQAQLRKFAFQVELATQDNTELHSGVVHLLQLVIDNIGELVIDEKWFDGQIKVLQEILSRPLDVRAIDNAERKLREVIIKQSQLKAGLVDAQKSLKTMLSDFVEQLASFTTDTGAYSEKIDAYAHQISKAGSLVELQTVVEDVLRETRKFRLTTQRTQEELQTARSRVTQAERKVVELEQDLALTSKLVRQDQLTGTLNRRGLEEVLDKEIARATRRRSTLCLAVLDIDNFKQLNDQLGHQAGDEALVHLTEVIRSNLRPQDSFARLGGEEFVILLPDTPLAEAREALVRVQRELTRRFFLHDNQRILITFSAGVTEIPTGQSRESAIARADELMYQAKQAGKNKVVSA